MEKTMEENGNEDAERAREYVERGNAASRGDWVAYNAGSSSRRTERELRQIAESRTPLARAGVAANAKAAPPRVNRGSSWRSIATAPSAPSESPTTR